MAFATFMPTEGYFFHQDHYPTYVSDAHHEWYGEPSIPDCNRHSNPPTSIPLATARRYLAEAAKSLDNSSYTRFLVLLGEINRHFHSLDELLEEVATLFQRHPQLVDGFNDFLPWGYSLQVPEQLTVSPKLLYREPPPSKHSLHDTTAVDEPALNFVLSVKRRYRRSPDKYSSFLSLMEQYQGGQLDCEEMIYSVERLFASDPRVLEEFRCLLKI